MSELTQPKTYKYKLDAESFVKLYLAPDYDFDFLKTEMLKNGIIGIEGIYRVMPSHLDEPDFVLEEDLECTIVEDTEIIGKLIISEVNKACINSLLCYNTKIDSIYFEKFNINKDCKTKGGHFYFDNCDIGHIHCKLHNTLGNFIFCHNTQISAFNLFNNSIIRNLEVNNSILKHLSVFNESGIKDVNINNSSIITIIFRKDSSACNWNISENSSIVSIKFSEQCDSLNLSINKSKVNAFDIKNSKLEDIKIDNNCILSNFSVKTGQIGSFTISNSNIGPAFMNFGQIGPFSANYSILDNISLFNSNIEDIKITDNCKAKDLILTGCTVGNVIFHFSKIGTINIANDSIIKDFYARYCDIIELSGEDLCNSFYITTTNISSIKLIRCNIPELLIRASNKFEAYLIGGQINLVNFSDTIFNKDTIVAFTSIKIYSIIFERFAILGILFMRQIERLEHPFMRNETLPTQKIENNSSNISFTDTAIRNKIMLFNENVAVDLDNKYIFNNKINKPTIRISQSSLGKTEFTDCPLADYKFQYNNSRIIDCFISGGTVPGNNIGIIDPISKEEIIGTEEHKQKASIYNQLKKIFEAQGDLYNATIFQCKWANHQEQYLKQVRKDKNSEAAKHPFFKKIKSYFNENSQDIYILWLNKISNNHGESWLRPLCWLLGSAFIFYIIYLWSIGRIFSGSNFNCYLFGYYFEFLNPLHKDDFIKYSSEASGCTVFINFTSKLFTAFFLYKFLAAFRKYGKK